MTEAKGKRLIARLGSGPTMIPTGRRESKHRPVGSREADYRRLARFRYALRRFLHFSEAQARAAGISPNQYQLMLFVRGFPGLPPTIAELAERLQVEHQSAVGLVDRSARAGLVRRQPDPEDGRRRRVALTRQGATLLARLVSAHAPEFKRLSAALFRAHSADKEVASFDNV